ncbi:MAG: DUF5056 domain-containing protein [Bacteroidales bacterium]|nr:DUF5056 domain-containing protein [Bacteroidales bacterium]
MMKDNDTLLKQFMDANRQEMADNGFSRRVMHRLPCRHNRAAQILNALCAVVSVFLFVTFDGIQAIIEVMRNVLVYTIQHVGTLHIDIKTMVVLFCLVFFFTVRLAWQHVDD